MPPEAKAYAQIIALSKTLELISLERRRCIDEDMKEDEFAKSINYISETKVLMCFLQQNKVKHIFNTK